MATIFSDMTTLASAAGSAFNQQQRQLNSTTAAAGVLTPSTECGISSTSVSLTGVSTSSSSSTSAAVLSGSSNCISTSSSSTTSVGTSAAPPYSAAQTVTQTAVSSTSSIHSSSFLAAAVSAGAFTSSATSSSSSLAVSAPICTTTLPSVTCSTLHSSKTSASPATTSSAHQLLLNGLGVSDADLSAVNSTSLAEDPRALQLALELSMVSLNDSIQIQVQQQQQQQQLQQLQQQHLQHMQHQQSQQAQASAGSFDMSTLSAAVAAAAAAANTSAVPTTSAQLNQFSGSLLPSIEDRSKKSQNMTECVPVPSSEHVAEIVGRQGCKIKALRAKTNTYIKTPVRGEEPVFVVTGRKEDVAKAKREILSAAEHFSVIRASRKPSLSSSLTGCVNGGCGKTPPGAPALSGHITIKVRVPYRVVGLVVGSKGATIKHIQQDTQTYIVTPSREREPIFDVTGLPHHVQAARKQIEAHIASRTGATDGNSGAGAVAANTGAVHTINSLSQILNDDISPEFLASIYKNGLCSTFDYADSAGANSVTANGMPMVTNNGGINLNLAAGNLAGQSLMNNTLLNSNNFPQTNGGGDFFNSMTGTVDNLNAHHVCGGGGALNPSVNGNIDSAGLLNGGSGTNAAINLNGGNSVNASNGVTGNVNGMSRSCSSASSTTSSKSANNGGGSNCSRPELSNIWKNLGESLDVDEGIGESPSIWTLPCVFNTPVTHYSSSTTSISPTDSLLRESNTFGQLLAIQTQQQHQQQQRSVLSVSNNSNNHLATLQQQQQQMILQQNQQLVLRRECLVCGDKEVTAALVPCGHNMFCMECANRICTSADSNCPVCSQSVFHAMRILP